MSCKILRRLCALASVLLLLCASVSAYEDIDKDGFAETSAVSSPVRVPSRLPIAGQLEGTFVDELGVVYALSETEAVVIGYDDNLPLLTLPDTCQGLPVTAIAESAFASKVKLTEIVLPESVKTIEKEAFAFASSLREVTLPEGLTVLPDGCFLGCDSLRTVALPSSLTEIGPSAFEGCLRLRKLAVPASVSKIADDAFAGCEALILDCESNAMAAAFAEAHSIDTSFFTTSTFVLLLAVALTLPLFLLLLLARCLYRRSKKSK
ncbi:MAG: leucine-rich repeat domain-containing protein [Ruminococcaceae bacterium]|nr:leucine-rich repeat domain-containing protein [Oscillospiraceae bacterium]